MNSITELIIQNVLSAIAGILIAIFTIRSQKSKKHIVYHTSSTPLIKFKPKEEQCLNVTVRESVLTGNVEDNSQVMVSNAYGHSITIKNTGNDVVEDIRLHIEFDQDTKVLEFSSIPENGEAYDIKFIRSLGSLNSVTLFIPYINERGIVHASIITADNKDANVVKVSGEGKNIFVKQYKERYEIIKVLLSMGLILFGILLFDQESAPNMLPTVILEFLGAEITTVEKEIAVWPKHSLIIGWTLFALVSVFLVYHAISKSLSTESKKLWE